MSVQKNTPILIIVGPTGSGKTTLAVTLAKKYNGEVISADSRQIYKGLDIGTEKITKSQMQGIPHHCIDIASPRRAMSAAQWAKHAQKAIENIEKKGKLPIIAGGTGFYIDALLYPHALPEVPPNAALRGKLDKQTAETLFVLLKKRDPARAKKIDPYNKRRLIRALEIAHALGKVPKYKKTKPRYKAIWIGLAPDMHELEKKLKMRLEKTIKKGLVKETKQLLESGFSKKRIHELGLEYRIALAYIDGKISKEEMRQVMLTALMRYAKRQMRWFKRNKDIQWFAGPPGLEPGTLVLETRILPLNYRPVPTL